MQKIVDHTQTFEFVFDIVFMGLIMGILSSWIRDRFSRLQLSYPWTDALIYFHAALATTVFLLALSYGMRSEIVWQASLFGYITMGLAVTLFAPLCFIVAFPEAPVVKAIYTALVAFTYSSMLYFYAVGFPSLRVAFDVYLFIQMAALLVATGLSLMAYQGLRLARYVTNYLPRLK